MVIELHQNGVSHGDLQDGNIMVVQNKHSIELKLVDYDSLFVPPMKGNIHLYDPDIPGLPSYQPPKFRRKFNEKADYFSELLIYLSLCAYAEKPNLWEIGQEKELLFGKDDLSNPRASSKFKDLKVLSPLVQYLSSILEEYCYQPDDKQFSPLEELIISSSASSKPETFSDFFGFNLDISQTDIENSIKAPEEFLNMLEQESDPKTFTDLFPEQEVNQFHTLPNNFYSEKTTIKPGQGKSTIRDVPSGDELNSAPNSLVTEIVCKNCGAHSKPENLFCRKCEAFLHGIRICSRCGDTSRPFLPNGKLGNCVVCGFPVKK